MISKEEMATHPYKNKIYNCLGGETPPQIDLADRHELFEGDTVLLCTDGVWGVISDQQIKEIIQRNSNITEATIDLMDSAEFASDEKGDNMSAIGLQWGERLTGQVAVSTQLMPLGETTTIMNPVTHQNMDGVDPLELSDDDIENTINAIQNALNKTQQKPKI
jgi:serine/threonine protein phosphatase PrpC